MEQSERQPMPTDGRIVLWPSGKTMAEHLKSWDWQPADFAAAVNAELPAHADPYPEESARNFIDRKKVPTDRDRRQAIQAVYNRAREAQYPEEHPAIKKRAELLNVLQGCPNSIVERYYDLIMPDYADYLSVRHKPETESSDTRVLLSDEADPSSGKAAHSGKGSVQSKGRKKKHG